MSFHPGDQQGTSTAQFRPLAPPVSDPSTSTATKHPSTCTQQCNLQESSMQAWLLAKSEEDKRKQEEEKTQQESMRLEQRKIEFSILRQCLDNGIPPTMVPMVFAALRNGRASNDTVWPQENPSQQPVPPPPQQQAAQPTQWQQTSPPMSISSVLRPNSVHEVAQQRPWQGTAPNLRPTAGDTGSPTPRPPADPEAPADSPQAKDSSMRPILFSFYTPPVHSKAESSQNSPAPPSNVFSFYTPPVQSKACYSQKSPTPPSKRFKHSWDTSNEGRIGMLMHSAAQRFDQR